MLAYVERHKFNEAVENKTNYVPDAKFFMSQEKNCDHYLKSKITQFQHLLRLILYKLDKIYVRMTSKEPIGPV